MEEKHRICIFCGAYAGARPVYEQSARALGQMIAERGYGIVYGGGRIGLMGAVADAALEAGGEVIGVIPSSLVDREVAHKGLSWLRVVETMHERKALMADIADAFIAMPGGYGTLDEFCEILTWAQLGIHHKPCGVLNVEGYFDSFLQFLQHCVDEGFLMPRYRRLFIDERSPERLLARLESFTPPEFRQLIDEDER